MAHRKLSSQVTATILFLAVAGLATLWAFVWMAVDAVDRAGAVNQGALITKGVERLVEKMPQRQLVALGGLQNLGVETFPRTSGSILAGQFSHDAMVFLERDGTTPPREIQSDPDFELETIVSKAMPLVRRLESSSARALRYAADVTAFPSGPAVISVVALGGGYHVAVMSLDAEVIQAVAHWYGIHEAAVVSIPPVGPSVPLRDIDGEVAGYVTWTPLRPGTVLLVQFAPHLLFGTVISALLAFLLIHGLRRSSIALQNREENASFLALHDTLTGLPNRRKFEESLDEALHRVGAGPGNVALLYVDLDRFKNVNDTLGHAAGDELVRQVASRIARAAEDADTVARIGGDEFCVVLEASGETGAVSTAKSIIAAVSEPFDLDGERADVGASVGIAVSMRGISPADLWRRADIALYEAKNLGRGRHAVFSAMMDEEVQYRRQIEQELRAALRDPGQLAPVYQPIFEAATGSIIGVETLARWHHPQRGLLLPHQFIALAEDRGLIVEVGDHILKHACLTAVQTGVPWIAVNVSLVQLRHPSFQRRLRAVLAETGLPPSHLVLEMTESMVNAIADASGLMAYLGELGVRIAIDDFGTGLSSFENLRRIGVQKLKIDRSFVRMLGSSDEADALVAGIVSLGHSMRMRVVAEGVETELQRSKVIAAGCDQMQGHLLSYPVASDELVDILSKIQSSAAA